MLRKHKPLSDSKIARLLKKKPKTTKACNSEEVGDAFGSIRALKQKSTVALNNMDIYLQRLDETLDTLSADRSSDGSNKRMRIIKEKDHVSRAKSDINEDLEKIDKIEKTFLKICTNLPLKKQKNR